MAGAAAEAGAAEEATEILTFRASLDHVIAKRRSRDAPMRLGCCRWVNLPSRVRLQ